MHVQLIVQPLPHWTKTTLRFFPSNHGCLQAACEICKVMLVFGCIWMFVRTCSSGICAHFDWFVLKIDMCRVWQAWVHMNHLVKGRICHILAQGSKSGRLRFVLKRCLLAWLVMPQDGVATHTAHAVLSSAAFADFQAEVVRLQTNGDARGAVRLWTSAVEIIHKPWGRLPMVRPPGLPPLRWAPCMDATCGRCLAQQGGFKFPWLGPWTRRRVLVAHGITPFEAWEALAASDTRLDCVLVAAYGSGLSAEDISPVGMEAVLERSGYERGAATATAVVEAWICWQSGSPRWVDPRPNYPPRVEAWSNSQARAQRALVGWLADTWTSSGPLPAACFWCGEMASKWCSSCGQNQCNHCLGRERVDPCCWEAAQGQSSWQQARR